MKASRFSKKQIISILNENLKGVPVKDIIRKHGISDTTYYNWKTKYGCTTASKLKQTKEMETKLFRLKNHIYEFNI